MLPDSSKTAEPLYPRLLAAAPSLPCLLAAAFSAPRSLAVAPTLAPSPAPPRHLLHREPGLVPWTGVDRQASFEAKEEVNATADGLDAFDALGAGLDEARVVMHVAK